MKPTDFIIIIIALILAYFMIKISWIVARFLIQAVFVLVIASILYIILKKFIKNWMKYCDEKDKIDKRYLRIDTNGKDENAMMN